MSAALKMQSSKDEYRWERAKIWVRLGKAYLIAVLSICKFPVRCLIDGVGNRLHRPIAHDDLATSCMGGTEILNTQQPTGRVVPGIVAIDVVQRAKIGARSWGTYWRHDRISAPANCVPVITLIHALIIRRTTLAVLTVIAHWLQGLLADQIGLRSSIRNVFQTHRAAVINDSVGKRPLPARVLEIHGQRIEAWILVASRHRSLIHPSAACPSLCAAVAGVVRYAHLEEPVPAF